MDVNNRIVAGQAASVAPALPRNAPPHRAELRRSIGFVSVAWIFGAVWFASLSGTPRTIFAQSLGASNFEFGLLAAMPYLAPLVSPPSSMLIDRTGKRRLFFFLGHYIQRTMWFPIAVIPLWIVSRSHGITSAAALSWFLVLMFIMHCGGAIGGPAWMSWMADLIPLRVRAHYFSRRRAWGMYTMIPASIIPGLVLDWKHVSPEQGGPALNTMWWCGMLFMISSVFGILDIASHHFVKHVSVPPQKQSDESSLLKPLADSQFLLFAGFVATITFAVSFMGQFATLYLIERLKVTNTQAQLILLVAPNVALLMVLSAWGKAVDRMGKKPVMALAALGLVPVGFGWCFMNTGAIWLGYILTAAGAALYGGVEVANMNMMMEMAGVDDKDGTLRSSYAAVNSMIVNIAGCAGGVSAGIIAQSLDKWTYDLHIPGLAPITFYEVLFALSGVTRLLAVVIFLPRLHEPKSKTAVNTLRFMTANIYNNLFSIVPWGGKNDDAEIRSTERS